jgi:hypothetical protein
MGPNRVGVSLSPEEETDSVSENLGSLVFSIPNDECKKTVVPRDSFLGRSGT